MPNYLPKVDSYHTITRTASADVIGGRIVEVTGQQLVANAAAGSVKTLGVAAANAASGEAVTVFINEGVQRPVASGAITAGQAVYVAAAGMVSATGTGTAYGTALTTAADGAQVEVRPIN